MFLSVLLIFTIDREWIFVFIFLLCGITDILDGFLARKLQLQSAFGARLDSLADLLLFGAMLVSVLITAGEAMKDFYPFLAVIVGIRLLNLLIAGIKYHCFLILHTWGNKLTGILAYAFVCFYVILKWDGILYTVLTIAALSAAEELLIHLSSKHPPDPDRRGLFWK
jgi:CDP-diacylglycerol--glycerol-3-phosphate 3-phosphatidyltransferase